MKSDKNILIVDDSALIRETILRALQDSGYTHLDTAQDGLEAFDKIKNKSFDMVISDYEMPNVNGGELVRHIKQKYPQILIIMLSAQSSKNVIIKLMRQIENYIYKDNIDSIRDELCFIVDQTFERDFLKKENQRMFKELDKNDKKMRLELQNAKDILSEILVTPSFQSDLFTITNFSHHSNIIGGDFYLFRKKDNKIQIILADISGHGIPAALLILTMKNAVDTVLSESATNRIIDKLNKELLILFPESKYATVSCIELNEEDGTIYYTNEFQNPILFVRTNGDIEEIDNGTYKMLGIYNETVLGGKTFQSKIDTLRLESGEKVILFTDGIVEARNEEKEEFGIERIKKIIRQNSSMNLKELTEHLYNQARNFSNNTLHDDITIIAIQKK